MDRKPLKQTSLCLIVRGDEILLAMKKRGFGAGKWNGYGGKQHVDEDLETTAVRETQEEVGVIVAKEDLQKISRMEFYFDNNPDWDLVVHLYKVTKWKGEPVETEEMRPQWFKISEIPFDKMWLEDRYWMSRFLADQKFEGTFYYNSDGTAINNHEIKDI